MPNHMVRRTALVALTAVLCCGAARVASAQVVIDPEIVEFTPSPDHEAATSGGIEIITRYDLQLYVAGTSTATLTLRLGKPDADDDGKIRVRFSELLSSTPAGGVTYVGKVVAVGPGGRGESAWSNQFSFGSSCSYGVTPTTRDAAVGGGSVSVAVSATAGCSWAAGTSSSWVTIAAGASGTGSGTVTLAVAANTGASARTATVLVAGQSVTISQAGTSCAYSLSPAPGTLPFGGADGTVTVTTTTGCTWSAGSSASWLAITAGASGSGSGTIRYSAGVNMVTSQRSATISVGGKLVTIVQSGVACSYALSASAVTMASSESSGTVSLTTPAGCPWVADSNAAWLSVTDWTSGSGSGTIRFDALANLSSAPRTALVAAGGQTLTVTQQGAGACAYTVSPTSRSVLPTGGSGTMAVNTAVGCAWTASTSASWVTISGPASGSGPGTVAYTVSANPTALFRSAQISAGGRGLLLAQSGSPCSYALSATSASLPASAASGDVDVITPAGCSWAITTTASWLTAAGPTFNSGNGTIAFTATANPLATARTAAVIAGGKTLSVTQAGASLCAFETSTNRIVMGRDPGNGTVLVTVGGSCALSATSDSSWLSVTKVVGSTGTVEFAVGRNDTGFDRAGALRIGSSVVTVTQKTMGAPAAPKALKVTGVGGGKQ